MTLRTDLDSLAAKIAKNAALSATSLQESVDALKALTSYYATVQKVDAKGQQDDEPGGATFEAFSRSLEDHQEEHPNGRAAVHRRQRNS